MQQFPDQDASLFTSCWGYSSWFVDGQFLWPYMAFSPWCMSTERERMRENERARARERERESENSMFLLIWTWIDEIGAPSLWPHWNWIISWEASSPNTAMSHTGDYSFNVDFGGIPIFSPQQWSTYLVNSLLNIYSFNR